MTKLDSVYELFFGKVTDYNFANGEVKRDLSELIESVLEVDIKEAPNYIINTVNYVSVNYGVIKTAVSPLLNNWTWDRLPLLTQAIILMSYTHYYAVDKTDKKVVINIAVTLAKKYVEEKQGKFVNALLDKFLK